jgi:hypothetical protein
VIGPGQAELRPQFERALDAPAEQRAVDLREAIGCGCHHAQPQVLGVRDREGDLVTTVVAEHDVLATEQRLADARGVDVSAAAVDERQRRRGYNERHGADATPTQAGWLAGNRWSFFLITRLHASNNRHLAMRHFTLHHRACVDRGQSRRRRLSSS